VNRPRNSTLILLGCFVATLVLYLAVRPDPEAEPRTQETNTGSTLVPAVPVPADEATTTTAPPQESTTTTEEEESTTTTSEDESTTSTTSEEDRSGAGTTSTSGPTTTAPG
jgi:hypothetical protein